jgi:two-component system response regulator PilR (NtrC family)/two-component system response regulator HydG
VTERILVVDDDASIRETFRHHLAGQGYQMATAGDAAEAIAQLAGFDPALVITDVRMPRLSGLELLQQLKEARPDLDVIVITAHQDMATAIGAMKAGAYDYLVKPLDLDQIDLVVTRCLRDRAARAKARRLTAEVAGPYQLDRIVGRDPAMIEVFKLIGSVTRGRTPVLIRGETGTGKELVARAIHYNSDAAGEPFVALNCTAIPVELLESELFGHVRGAFTGAVSDRRGRFELAGRGTIFLDEIGDTSPALQAKLLRVLQEREFFPVGSEKSRRTEARVIAATNRDLKSLVKEERFREDLYYRLKVVEIRLPPLRDRPGDIPVLARHFLEQGAREMHLPAPTLSEPALKVLTRYDWPGNVRELEHTLTRAMVLARGGVIGAEHLPLGAPVPGRTDEPEDDSLEAAERAQVRRVLARTGGNKRQASALLGISRPTLDRLMEKHGLAGGVVKDVDTGGQES